MAFKSQLGPFKSQLAETTFINKYQHQGCETWADLAHTLVEDVCRDRMTKDEKTDLKHMIATMKFIPGGRYLYYAGRDVKYFNNCYLLRAEEDTREDWADLSWKAESCLMTGGGIGVDYSRYRSSGMILKRSGGLSSGPIPKMFMIDEIGANVMQGGSRRSAIYASLNWKHGDIERFLTVKDWDSIPVAGTGYEYKNEEGEIIVVPDKSVGDLKKADFNFKAPLDMTNISVNYDTQWLLNYMKTGDTGEVFQKNVEMAMRNGEPGFSFNFFDKENETLRNACTEVTSSDDSDVCNLGSINLGRVDSIEDFAYVCELATKFLLCGTFIAHLPYDKIRQVREQNRRLGLGLMGIHEWLIKKGYKYEVTQELHNWLEVYRGVSDHVSNNFADTLGCSVPVAVRAIAPTGTIGILADTTTGIEPLFAVAYKRRYLTGGKNWKYQYHVDHTAQHMINEYDVKPDTIDSAYDLATDPERRIKFQADIQDYVDQSISSTINLPPVNKQTHTPKEFATILAKYVSRLRGFTVYPDGARGGQPLNVVSYEEAVEKLGEEFEEGLETNDVCELNGSGYCGS